MGSERFSLKISDDVRRTITKHKWSSNTISKHDVFDVCMILYLWYDIMNNQLDVTITIY